MQNKVSTNVKSHVMYVKNILSGEPPERKFITQEQREFIYRCKAQKQSIQLSDGTVYEYKDILRIEPIKSDDSEMGWANMTKTEDLHISNNDYGMVWKFIVVGNEDIRIEKVAIEKANYCKIEKKFNFEEKNFYYRTTHKTIKKLLNKQGEEFRILDDSISFTGEKFTIHEKNQEELKKNVANMLEEIERRKKEIAKMPV